MKRITVSMNQFSEEYLDQLLIEKVPRKTDVLNYLVSRCYQLEKELESVTDQLMNERKRVLPILRHIEDKVNVLYQLENTHLEYERYERFYPTTEIKNKMIGEAEQFVRAEKQQEVFEQYERLLGSKQ